MRNLAIGMRKSARLVLSLVLMVQATLGFSQQGPETGAHLPSQAAADVIREATGADGAFLAAGLIKETYAKEDLSSLLKYATDQIVVLNLSGSQVRQAMERSLSLYPQPNTSFLQISGFEVTFSKSAAPNSRVLSISVGGGKLDDGRMYTVAMPSNLGRGALGYFKIWDKAKIVRTLGDKTLEDVLKGKRFSETAPRWLPQG